MKSQDEVVLTLTEDPNDDYLSGNHKIKRSTRNCVLLSTFLFRTMGLLVYLFSTWFTNAFVIPFVCIITMLSFDFWVIKNISGRILVRLRWWSFIDEAGKTQWIFESSPFETPETELTKLQVRQTDMIASNARYFWISLVAYPIIWFVMVLTAVFSLKIKWGFVATIALFVKLINLYGYIKCRFKDSSEVPNKATFFKLFSSLASTNKK